VDGDAEVDNFLTHIVTDGGRDVMRSELGEKEDLRRFNNGLAVEDPPVEVSSRSALRLNTKGPKSSTQREVRPRKEVNRVDT
jgi:hypothetical protein